MRKFNVSGTCFKDEHYMVDTSNKIERIMQLVEQGDYFVINRPRQYGKTTTLALLHQRLKNEYLVIDLSFESIGQESYVNVKEFIAMFHINVRDQLELLEKTTLLPIIDELKTIDNFNEFSRFITRFIKGSDKEVVLIIDEVDDGSNNEVFLKFLGVLRNLYLNRKRLNNNVFKSVILAGVHDIKNLKYRRRGDGESKYNSPWNIAVDFDIDMSFNAEEVKSLLLDYLSEHREVTMDINLIANRIHYFTNGYPFLVSYLCKFIDEKLDKNWSEKGIEEAIKIILDSDNTNFDSLIQNIENHKDLYNLVWSIIVDGKNIEFVPDAPDIKKGILYGIVMKINGAVAIHNQIYYLRIHRYLLSRLRADQFNNTFEVGNVTQYHNRDGSLNMELILDKFMVSMKELHDEKQDKFIEDNARLLFSLFVRPIINGKGFMYFEPVISDKKRLDVVITYNEFRYIIELKIWRGEQYMEAGKDQLNDYLDRTNTDEGYMVIFDFRKVKHQRFTKEEIECNGKRILAIYV